MFKCQEDTAAELTARGSRQHSMVNTRSLTIYSTIVIERDIECT